MPKIEDQVPLPFAPGSQTSETAAKEMRGKAGTDRRRVLDYITARGELGATADQVQADLEMTHQSCSARVSELWHKMKVIRPNGRKRRTRSGAVAAVYVAVQREG